MSEVERNGRTNEKGSSVTNDAPNVIFKILGLEMLAVDGIICSGGLTMMRVTWEAGQ
jgi:hypothetical protein